MHNLLVTGGCGFIGSSFVRYTLQHVPSCEALINLDLLTYAGSLENVCEVAGDPRYSFIRGDIRDEALVEQLCRTHNIDTIVHFAAETHVDRSITDPLLFYQTNVEGTLHLLEVVRRLPHIHFHHVSTDEVYGSLPETGSFSENSPYRPNSPYAASKAASDHCVRAHAHTWNLSTTISHCTNNYGPCQHTEKLIPHLLSCCLANQPLPIYGNGQNVRDWLFVDDHSAAIWHILRNPTTGGVYGIGGNCEKKNIDVAHQLIEELAHLQGRPTSTYYPLLSFVPDRPGHDVRYAIDTTKIRSELGWTPQQSFSDGLRKTLAWYLEKIGAHSKDMADSD